MAVTMTDPLPESFARVVHDLRSPLTVIRGLCDVIGREELPPHTRRGLRAIDGEVTRLNRALDGLAGRSPQAIRQTIDLGAVAAAAGERFRWAATERGITITARCDRPAAVIGDPVALARVADNLVGNAIRHCREGGRVRLRTLVRSGWVHLCVRDDGDGVREGDRQAIFHAGERGSHPVGPGQGLGLAIASELAAAHGGAVALDRVRSGACFRLVLPEATGGAEQPWPAA